MTVPPVPPERPEPSGLPEPPVVPRPGPGRPPGPPGRRGASRGSRPVRGGPARPGLPAGPDPGFWGADRPGPSEWLRPLIVGWIDGWRDRLGDHRIRAGAGAVAIGALALVAGLVWYGIGVGGAAPAPRPSTTRPTADPPGTVAAGPAPGRGGALVVHVAGDVAHPGVVTVPTGSRVVDALARAGGPQPDADLDRLNLAAKVLDGQRIVVPRVGAPVVGADQVPAEGVPVDLNSATVAQLDTLPGIGPALAAAIVTERERRGGFRSVDELGDVRGIGPARLADLRARVAV